jgi:hypothetical protein
VLLLGAGGLLAFTLLLAVACTAPSDSGNDSGTTGAVPTSTITPPPAHTPIAFPRGGGQPPVGVAGIRPHLGGVPAFTTDDMAAYVKQNPLPQNFGGNDQATIVTSQFLAGGDLKALLGTSAGRPDEAMVGFVLLKGHFAFLGAGPNSPPPSFPYAYVLFDAQTGNLLMYGGLNQPHAPKPTPTPTAQILSPTNGQSYRIPQGGTFQLALASSASAGVTQYVWSDALHLVSDGKPNDTLTIQQSQVGCANATDTISLSERDSYGQTAQATPVTINLYPQCIA